MGWSCTLCTFENAVAAARCAICEHPAAGDAGPTKTPTKTTTMKSKSSPSPSPDARPSKKPRGTVQAMLTGVGSSREAEARRLQRKVQQMRELGIDLPPAEMLPLLARHCYSVPVAANAYFERMARGDDGGGSAALDSETARRIDGLVARLERGIPGCWLLGSANMAASVTRSGAKLRAGQELVLQAENAGKKRLRPGAGGRGASPAASTTSTPSPLASPPTAVTASGFVRVLDASQTQIGRLEREFESMLHPLMKEKLVVLGGLCLSTPLSTQMFAAFEVTVFVYVSERAFAIFDEEHPQFYLADALYSLLELLKPKTDGATSDAASDLTSDAEAPANMAGMDTLFSECAGANDMLATGGGDGEQQDSVDPSEQLKPLLLDIELREHQKQALRWMLWREQLDQSRAGVRPGGEATSDADADAINPMWEERAFRGDGSGSYYVNPFEKIASLRRPKPPKPCLGGILADDMGMGKTMMMLSLVAHRKYFGGGESALEDRHRSIFERRCGGEGRKLAQTLVVCPLSLLDQWKLEAEERFRSHALAVHVYYGDERDAGSVGLATADVVLTTYGVLSAQHDKAGSAGFLARTPWHRVILDEAHSIKNRATGYFRACAALAARHRWCLTGTPIQNSLDDVFSLLSFLRYEPWSRAAWWARVIARPVEAGEAAAALARLKAVLSPVLLRRTKLSRDARGELLVRLPAKEERVVTLDFSPDERAFYQAVFDKSRAEFSGFVASGAAMGSYVAIFALLLRLRQACDHPLLALGRDLELAESAMASKATTSTQSSQSFQFRPWPDEGADAYCRRISAQLQQDGQTESAQPGEGESTAAGAGPTRAYVENVLAQVEGGLEAHECPVCLDPPRGGVLTACAHVLCGDCLRDALVADPGAGCPVCRAPVDLAKVFVLPEPENETKTGAETGAETETEAETETGEEFLSTKLRRLVRDLEAVRAEDRACGGPPRKVVVFSQWTRMLEMAAATLTRRGFGCRVFHGGLSREARERVLRAFARSSAADGDVLAVSLRAGGVGLNLTSASVVVLLDPWWNPGVEQQAVDRVHRLGQPRAVTVLRYVVRDTVEDVLLEMQARKQALAARALVAHGASRPGGTDDRALSLDDLKRFFQG